MGPREVWAWVRRQCSTAPEVASFWATNPNARREYVINQAGAWLLGVSLLTGSGPRMASPAFDVMRKVSGPLPWLPWSVLLLLGAAALFGAQRHSLVACHWALRIGAGVYAVIALSFGIAAWPPSYASWWGTIFTLWVCATHLSDAAEYPSKPPPPTPGEVSP